MIIEGCQAGDAGDSVRRGDANPPPLFFFIVPLFLLVGARRLVGQREQPVTSLYMET